MFDCLDVALHKLEHCTVARLDATVFRIADCVCIAMPRLWYAPPHEAAGLSFTLTYW